MKRFIVLLLEKFCTLVDNKIVVYLPESAQVHWFCRPAELSATLDEKWKTGVWK